MNASDSLAIVDSAISAIQSNLTTILPVVLPVLVVLAVLYFAWRKLFKSTTTGK